MSFKLQPVEMLFATDVNTELICYPNFTYLLIAAFPRLLIFRYKNQVKSRINEQSKCA